MGIHLLTDYAMFFTISPFIITLLTYIILKFIVRNKWKALHLTAQLTAIFYFLAVIILIEQLFQLKLLSYLLVSFIVFLSIHLVIQRKNGMEISLFKAIIILLRFIFLLFSLLYIILGIVYIVQMYS